MKRHLALLLTVALLLSLAACASSGGTAPETKPAETMTTLPTTAVPESTAAPDAETAGPAATTTVPWTESPETEAHETEVPETEAPETEPPTTTEGYVPPEDPWSLIGERLFAQGSYTDDCGNYYDYSYDLPCLLADTPGAREINAAIEVEFAERVQNELDGMEEARSLILYHAGFRGELWENVLTLVVIGNLTWGMDYFGVYCYDVSTGLRLTTPELLERMGVSEEDFLAACREEFRACYIEKYRDYAEDPEMKPFYDQRLEEAVSDRYVNLDLQIYPDATGDIVVVAPIASIAGAEYYEQELHLGIDGVG